MKSNPLHQTQPADYTPAIYLFLSVSQSDCVIRNVERERELYPDLLSLTGADWSDRYLALRHPSYSWAASSLPVSHDDKN